jgi:long-chain acyl-CoA synthetase
MTSSAALAPLDPSRLLSGTKLLVIGGTGFLGKIFCGMLLHRYPEVGRIYLVVRRTAQLSSEERFWAQIAPSHVFDPLRERLGEGFDAFLREKVTPIDGDLGRPECGIAPSLLDSLAGQIAAVVNVAGVVDFNPPLDEALHANAFGAQCLLSVARRLGDVPVMHTSTCYVAGRRKGPIEEVDPCTYPFPRCDELDPTLWDPEREIAECLDLVAQARHRCEDAFRQSEFVAAARKNLLARGEPTEGKAFSDELATVKRKFISKRLVAAGLERAAHWGWPNIYTYTKSIGEQVVARSGLRFTIVRPACSESCDLFPFPGWNEGVNTSSPLIYLSLKGAFQLPGADTPLDFIPADTVCAGMILSLCELLEGTHRPVYQYGTSDINPCNASRIGELIGLYKRKYYQRTGTTLGDFIQAHYEPVVLAEDVHDVIGPKGMSKATGMVSRALGAMAIGPAKALLKPAAKAVAGFSAEQAKIGEIMDLFSPFTSHPNGPFSCANTRAAYARLSDEDKGKLPWTPDELDWHKWMHEVHMPGFEKWVLPEMDRRRVRPERALRPHHTLVSLLLQMAERHDLLPAMSRLEPDGLSRVTYRDLAARSAAAAARLAAMGVRKGSRVLICAQNHPDWAIAYFGALRAGATAVPVDASLEADAWVNVARESASAVAIVDGRARDRVGSLASASLPALALVDLGALCEEDASLQAPDAAPSPDDVASLIYTSGTTGKPKGVMLTHANFTALVSSLAPVFPLGSGDRVLSVLPLHHTFEFTCGLLLPISRGARIVYLDELTADRLGEGLRAGRITAMVGVPALWQMLERRILAEVKDRGRAAETAFQLTASLNRTLGKKLGLDAGKLLFGGVHAALGGNMRYLISGGAALPRETHQLFSSLGLHLTEGYGLTEAAPVLTVSKPSPGGRHGHVGKAVPGVEIKIASPDKEGVGEVLARGASVMAGYEGDAESTSQTIDAAGWLHTGDLGKLDKQGRLSLVGRAKDVVVTSTGENLYPDDIERMLGQIRGVDELVVLGVAAPSGGERLACVAVPAGAPAGASAGRDEGDAGSGGASGAAGAGETGGADEQPGGRIERGERAMRSLREAISKLPSRMQPSMIEIYEAPLPRTATRKVKRPVVRAMLARRVEARAGVSRAGREQASRGRVAAAVSAISGRPAAEVLPAASLAGDLGFDSLMMVELHAALEAPGARIDADAMAACKTVAELEALFDERRDEASSGSPASSSARDRDGASGGPGGREPVALPPALQAAGKLLLGRAQQAFYGKVMSPRVYGRAFIPHDRPTIVVANHASHLDMGFVKHALGSYGEGIVALAAQDYFFGEGSLRRAYVENLTNLKAIDRKAGVRQGLRQAGEVIEKGHTVLVFPEGTRSPDGQLGEFRPLVGQLALEHDRDLLPVYLGGTFEAMPKGSKVPARREIVARIGPPLAAVELRRLTAGLGWAEAAREVARLAQRAVEALRDGGALDLRSLRHASEARAAEHPVVSLMGELPRRFQPGKLERALVYYVTLGTDDQAKWTVRADGAACVVARGKPEGAADCVLKTSPEMFGRIVREGYTPGVAEFVSGTIKTSDVELLQRFTQIFALGDLAS